MDELHLSYDKTLESLTKAVEANPDRVSRTAAADICSYFYEADGDDLAKINKVRQQNGLEPVVEGAPNCIVGQVMADHGVTLGDLRNVYDDVWNSKGNLGMNVEDLARVGWLHADERTMVLLARAQTAQDSNNTWKEALEAGLRRVDQYDAVNKTPQS